MNGGFEERKAEVNGGSEGTRDILILNRIFEERKYEVKIRMERVMNSISE